jgi:hypothetical protein
MQFLVFYAVKQTLDFLTVMWYNGKEMGECAEWQ